MTAPEIQARIRDLSRKIKALRRQLPRAPSAAFKGRTRAEDRASKREAHRRETARIRDERMAICGGRCEAADRMALFGRCYLPAAHMHHMRGGNGRRRQQQSVDTVRMLCVFHHFEAHGARIEGKVKP